MTSRISVIGWTWLTPITFLALTVVVCASSQANDIPPRVEKPIATPIADDFPSIRIEAERVDFGVRIDTSREESLSVATMNSVTKTISRFQETERIESQVNSFKSSVASKLAMDGSTIALSGTGTANGSISLSNESSNSNTSTLNDVERKTLKEEAIAAASTIRKFFKKSAFGPNSGFISTGLTIRNLGRSSVALTNIRLSIVAVDPFGIYPSQTIAATCVRPEHLLFRHITGSVEQSTDERGEVVGSSEIHKGNVAEPSYDAKYVSCDRSYTTTAWPDEENFPPERLSIHLDGLRSDKILDLIDRGMFLYMEVSHWDVLKDGRTLDVAKLRNDIQQHAVRLRVIFPNSRIVERYVDVSGGASLIDILNRAAIGSIVIEPDSRKQMHVSRIGSVKSDFLVPSDPKSYPEAELAQGTWIVVNQSNNYFGTSISDKLPPGAAFTLVWMTKGDLQNKERKPFRLEAEAATTEGSPGPSQIKCGSLVLPGDSIDVSLDVIEESIQTRTFKVGLDSAATYEAYKEYFGPDPLNDVLGRRYLGTVTVPTKNEQILSGIGLGNYGVSFRFGQGGADIPLNAVPTGSLVESAFKIRGSFKGPSTLPSDGLPLCFSVTQAPKSFRLGRTAVVPDNPGQAELAPVGTVVRWRNDDPLRDKLYAIGRKAILSGSIVHQR